MATTTTETLNGQVLDVLRRMEERLCRVEEQVAAVTNMQPQQPDEPWWKRFCGVFEGSEVAKRARKRTQRDRRADYAKVTAEIDRPKQKSRRPAKRSRAAK